MRLTALLLTLFCAAPAAAQVLRVAPGPIEQALVGLADQARVRVVYAERLVAGRATTCQYRGNSLDEAFACTLDGHPLQLVRRRQGQYVLRAATQASSDPLERTPRRETLSGFVRDARTGEVLPGASVYLPRVRRGAAASAAGVFTLADLPAGAHRVRVSYVGYLPADTVLLTQSPRNVVALTPTRVLAAPVEIESEVAAQPGLTDIPPALLDELPTSFGEADMLQRLTWLPGIERAGEATGGLVVRGGEPDENLYLLDGAPVYHPWHAFSLVSTFQTDTFSRVRLFRSIYPAEFGGRISAVLDAEMRDGNRETPRAQAAVGLLSGRYLIESPVTRGISFMLSGRRSYIDRLIGRTHPVEADGQVDTLRTGYVFGDLSAKLTWRPGFAHRVSLSHYSGSDDLDLRLPFDFSLDADSWLRPADLFFEVDHGWGNQLQSLRYQYLPSTQLFASATLYRSAYAARENSLIRPAEDVALASNYRVRLDEYGFKTGLEAFPRAGLSVRAGADVAARRFRSRLAGRSDQPVQQPIVRDERVRQTAFESALYAQVDAEAGRWELSGGARLSTSSEGAYVFVDPNASAAYRAHPRLVLRSGVGASSQYLHRLRDRFSVLYDLLSSRWLPADASLRPARARTAAAGLEWRPARSLRVDAETFVRQTRGVLVPFEPEQLKDGLEGPGISTGALLGQYARADGRAVGYEVSVEYVRGELTAWLFGSGVVSERLSAERGDERFTAAAQSIPLQVRAVVGRSFGRWEVGASGEVRSGEPFAEPTGRFAVTDPVTGDPSYFLVRPAAPNARLPVYTRVNLTATRRWRLLEAEWQLRVDLYNALNTRNTLDRTYRPAPDGVSMSDRRGLPILPLFELQVTL